MAPLRFPLLLALALLLLGGALGYWALSQGVSPGPAPSASWRVERRGEWWVYTLSAGGRTVTFRERALGETAPPVVLLPVDSPSRPLLLQAAGAGALAGAGLALLALSLLGRPRGEEALAGEGEEG